jgi:hypothetical protein
VAASQCCLDENRSEDREITHYLYGGDEGRRQ